MGITHISSGDLLRKHIADQTSLGTSIRGYVERGDLVPDQIVMDMLRKPVVAANANGGYVLDGFPGTVHQAEAYLAAKDLGVAVRSLRISTSITTSSSGDCSRVAGSEDTQEIIDHRLRVYEEQTRPMLEYYAEREKLVVVNGARPVDEVTWSLQVQLQRVQRHLRGGRKPIPSLRAPLFGWLARLGGLWAFTTCGRTHGSPSTLAPIEPSSRLWTSRMTAHEHGHPEQRKVGVVPLKAFAVVTARRSRGRSSA